ncbi:Na/Pi cotransporter family protein [Desulfopila inferna]|uniref:Na/Pi cotransporter family protein n=1 Tax=Desulfopila inferna TaxID=468528 RepID=UPI0019638C72|nr:Na/Pi cotransporter family protein [Desulfopila inferna]MBM9605292.1 Na/Pi cotransporter family protein [Desulfopila inferna]
MDGATIVFKLLGGLVLFMFSIRMLSDTMKRAAGPRLKLILEKATATPLGGMFTGTLVTFLVQSSSVTVLLLLGLVNAGVMKLRQAIFVILGSEIGTTFTAQIVAFKVTILFFPLIIVGFILQAFFPTREGIRDSGEIVLFLGLVFLAMKIMADGAAPLREYPQVIELIIRFGTFPLLGILMGTLFTALTSSSSATTSLVIAMSMEGVIDLSSGISLIVGANIGTCVLELFATIGTGISAKRTGLAQFIINLTGALLIYPVIVPFADLISKTADVIPRQIANAHTIFNVSVSFLLLPFSGILVSLLEKIVPGKEKDFPDIMASLDSHLLKVPALALYRAEEEVYKMVTITDEMLKLAGRKLFSQDKGGGKTVRKYEENIDLATYAVTEYVHQISTLLLSNRDRLRKRAIIHSLTDIERIADLAENLVIYADQPEIIFSEPARKDLQHIFENATMAYDAAVQTVRKKRKIIQLDVPDMENQVNTRKTELRMKYLKRQVKKGEKTAVDAFYPAVFRDLERIGSHSFNIIEHFDTLD